MKIIGKKNLKIIAATAMTIFSLFAATLGAFAWFAGKVQDSKNADEFTVTVNTGRFKNLYFHHHESTVIDSDTYKPISYTFESAPSGQISYDWSTQTATYSGETVIDMDDYTPLDFAQPILLVFELNDTYTLANAGEITIDAKTEADGFLGARKSDNTAVYDLLQEPGYYQKDGDNYYYALSSVINFYCTDSANELYNKNGDVNTTLKNTTYTVSSLKSRETCAAAKEADPNAVEPDLTFTTVNNDTDEYSFNKNPSIYKSEANSTVKYISIVIDYYSDALDYIYSTYLGDHTLEDVFESHLEFLCDWGLEIN